MKKLLLLALLITSFQEVISQNLLPVKINGLYGYCNQQKEIVIPPQYEDAELFDSNYAIVETKLGVGIINRGNQFVVEPVYKYITPHYFYEVEDLQLYTLSQEDEDMFKTFIGRDNHLIHKKFSDFEIDTNGTLVFKKKYTSRWGFRYENKKLNRISVPKYNASEEGCTCNLTNGRYYAQMQDSRIVRIGDKVGFRNVPNSAAYYTDTTVVMKVPFMGDDHDAISVKLSYINIPPIYDSIKKINDCYIVKDKNHYGIVDRRNQSLLGIQYDSILPKMLFSRGLHVYKNGKVGVFILPDYYKKTAFIKPEYQTIHRTRSSKYYAAMQNNLWGIIDKKGRHFVPFQFDFVELDYRNEFAIIGFNGKEKNLFDINKQAIVFPKRYYEHIRKLSDYSNAVLQYEFFILSDGSSLDFYIPQSGKLTHTALDTVVKITSSGDPTPSIIFKYKKGKKWGIVKFNAITGAIRVFPSLYDRVLTTQRANGKTFIRIADKSRNIDLGYIDTEGNEYFP